MKATVMVRLKPEVLDPQGSAVERALRTLGFPGVRGVRIGKLVELEIDGADDVVKREIEQAAAELLVNPVIEDCEIRYG